MAIGATAHKLILDSTKFVEGATLSRKELRLVKEVMKETATDAEKYGAAQDQLAKLHAKGALSTEKYEQAMEKLNEEFKPAQVATGGLLDKMKGMMPVFDPISLGLKALSTAGDLASAAFNAVGDAVSYATDKIGEQIEAIDELMAEAATLGISAAAFQNIAGAAELADLEVNKVGKAMERMLAFVSKKGEGSVFEQLKISAKELRDLKPDQILVRILDALEGIGNQADRVRFAKEIFGNPDLLRLSADAIRETAKRMEEMGASIDELDAAQFDKFDQEWTKLKQTFTGVWTGLTIELIPAFRELTKVMTDVPLNDIEVGVKAIGEVAQIAAIAIKGLAKEISDLSAPTWITDMISRGVLGPLGGAVSSSVAGSVEGGAATVGESRMLLQILRGLERGLQNTPSSGGTNDLQRVIAEELRKIEQNTREKIETEEVTLST